MHAPPVQALLRASANVRAELKKGSRATPLHIAAKVESTDVLRALCRWALKCLGRIVLHSASGLC